MSKAKSMWTAAGVVMLMACGMAEARQQRSVMVTSEMTTRGFDASEPEGLISSRSLDRYVRPLRLNGDQKEAIKALHEGYVAAFREASKSRREAMEKLLKENEDEDDKSSYLKKIPELQQKYAEQTKKLEQGLFSDVKSLLSGEQEGQWAKVERARRREVGLRTGGIVGGDGVDLTSVLEELKLSEAEMGAVGEPVEQYEADLDRQLVEKEGTKPDFKFESGKPIDVEAMQASMSKAREQAVKVRDLNERHARTIEGHLPEGKRSEFAAAVRRASFPRIYRASRVEKEVEAALKFEDLTSEQRKEIETLREQYRRDAGPLNESWSTAQRSADEKGDGGGQMIGPGGSVVRMKFSMGDEEEEKGPLADARKARKELDKRSRDRLKEILTAAQREKLPKGESGEESGAVVMPRGGGVLIGK